MRRHRWLAVAGVVAMIATACGTRLPDETFIEAGALSEQTQGGTGVAAGPTGGTSDNGTGSTRDNGTVRRSTGGSGGSGSGGSASGGSGSGGSASGGSGDAGGGTGGGGGGDGGAGGPNTASDVGVTETSIKVGNITGIQGLLGPEAFTPILRGAQAYFAAINDRGGINGRKVNLVTCDDRDDTEQSQACVRKLIDQDKVFALVGNSSTAYDPAAKYTNDKKVPDVGGGPIGNAYWRYPYLFGALGGDGYPRDGKIGVDGKLYAQTGIHRWYKENLGVSKGAVFFYTIPISRQAGLFIAEAMKREGIEVAYYGGGSDRGREATDPNYDSDVIEMQERGVDMIFNAIDIAGFQKLCQAMDRQGFTVKVNAATVQGWGQKVGQDFSSPCRNSVFANDEWRNYADTDHPAVAEMNQVMQRYRPNDSLRQWHMWGYGGAKMFSDGVASMGANVTREGLVSWLNSFTDAKPYTAGDLHSGLHWETFSHSSPRPDCFTIAQWQDSAQTFVTKASAFTCVDSAFFSYTPQDTGG